MPERIQLSRRAGWRLPLNAKSVARPHRWGNPFKVGVKYPSPRYLDPGWLYLDSPGMMIVSPFDEMSFRLNLDRNLVLCDSAATAVKWFRSSRNYRDKNEIRAELAGLDLACWCRLDMPCHADVLLELANS